MNITWFESSSDNSLSASSSNNWLLGCWDVSGSSIAKITSCTSLSSASCSAFARKKFIKKRRLTPLPRLFKGIWSSLVSDTENTLLQLKLEKLGLSWLARSGSISLIFSIVKFVTSSTCLLTWLPIISSSSAFFFISSLIANFIGSCASASWSELGRSDLNNWNRGSIFWIGFQIFDLTSSSTTCFARSTSGTLNQIAWRKADFTVSLTPSKFTPIFLALVRSWATVNEKRSSKFSAVGWKAWMKISSHFRGASENTFLISSLLSVFRRYSLTGEIRLSVSIISWSGMSLKIQVISTLSAFLNPEERSPASNLSELKKASSASRIDDFPTSFLAINEVRSAIGIDISSL